MKKQRELSDSQRVVGLAAEEYIRTTPVDEQTVTKLGEYMHDYDVLVDAAKQLHGQGEISRLRDPEAFAAGNIRGSLINRGAVQQFDILDAAVAVVDTKTPRTEIPDILRRSHALGSLFGQIHDRPSLLSGFVGSVTPSEEVAYSISDEPSRYLLHADDRVVYSKEGVNLIKPLLRIGMGCPALRQVVELAGGKTTVYAASWAANTEDFIEQRFTPTP